MREIKFRAWLPSEKEMIILPFAALQYFDFEGSYALSFVVDGYKGFWGHEMYERTTKEKCTDAVIMQFTGLLDKNGKEAYFHDLVKIEPCGMGFEDEPFLITQDDFGIPCFLHPSRFAIMITFEQYFLGSLTRKRTDFEIVGNAFENPDLLK